MNTKPLTGDIFDFCQRTVISDTDRETFLIPNEEIDQWLQIYQNNFAGRSDMSDELLDEMLDELWDEFNIHMPYDCSRTSNDEILLWCEYNWSIEIFGL